MAHFIFLKDNEDDTMTMVSNLSGEEQTWVIPVAFSSLMDMVFGLTQEQVEVLQETMENVVLIPNSLEG